MAAKRATRRERNDLDAMVVGIGVRDVHLSRLRLHRLSLVGSSSSPGKTWSVMWNYYIKVGIIIIIILY